MSDLDREALDAATRAVSDSREDDLKEYLDNAGPVVPETWPLRYAEAAIAAYIEKAGLVTKAEHEELWRQHQELARLDFIGAVERAEAELAEARAEVRLAISALRAEERGRDELYAEVKQQEELMSLRLKNQGRAYARIGELEVEVKQLREALESVAAELQGEGYAAWSRRVYDDARALSSGGGDDA